MTTLNKEQIVDDLRAYVAKFESQNKAANSLKNVSPGTISQMLNGKHENISDEMWRNVASQITSGKRDLVIVETRNFKVLTSLLSDAKKHSNVFAVIDKPGSSKTVASKAFVNANANTYRLNCSEYWNRKYFLAELLSAMGRDYSGLTVAEMMYESISQLKKKDAPSLILDEADKLTDQVLYFFITLYNELEDKCGIVLIATDHLEKRIKKGLKLNKKGYQEIYSRMGRKCIELPGVGYTDVHGICAANGIDDTKTIKDIWNDCEGDLRRVKRLIHAKLEQQNGRKEI